MYGIDCSKKLNPSDVQNLKKAGVLAIGRYLGRNLWNGLTTDEVQAILNAGLSLFLILELNPTKASYFSFSQGFYDAQFALAEAQYLGVPKGTCIYFTVDYDAQPGDMAAIQDYFYGVHTVLTGKYLVGAYGSYAAMLALQKADYPPDRYYQTYAWSGGQTAPNHIYQYSNDVQVAGVMVDQDYVNDDAGLWIAETVSSTTVEKESDFEMDYAVVYFTANDYSIAKAIADLHGGCAMFCRNGSEGVHSDAKKAAKVFNVGGPALGWSNEVYLSGDKALDTVNAVAQAYVAGKLV